LRHSRVDLNFYKKLKDLAKIIEDNMEELSYVPRLLGFGVGISNVDCDKPVITLRVAERADIQTVMPDLAEISGIVDNLKYVEMRIRKDNRR
jgi:hypothetical protein